MAEDWQFWKLAVIGAACGIVAGFVMLIFMTIVTTIGGPGPWATPKWIADTIYGDSWLGFNATNVFTGIALHLVVSLILGGLFAMIAVPLTTSPRQMLIAGAIWGLVAWVILSLLVMHALNETMAMEAPAVPWFIANLIFGVVLAFLVHPLRSAAIAPAPAL